MTDIDLQAIATQACTMFSTYLEERSGKMNVLLVVAPVSSPTNITAASNAVDPTAKMIARTFMNSRNDYSRQLVDELPPARSLVPELPATTDVHLMVDNQYIIVSSSEADLTPMQNEPEPIDLSEMAAQACEQIISLFETNRLEMDCFIAIASRALRPASFARGVEGDVTAASTATGSRTNIMLHKFLDLSHFNYSHATTNHVMYLEEPDEQ